MGAVEREGGGAVDREQGRCGAGKVGEGGGGGGGQRLPESRGAFGTNEGTCLSMQWCMHPRLHTLQQQSFASTCSNSTLFTPCLGLLEDLN